MKIKSTKKILIALIAICALSISVIFIVSMNNLSFFSVLKQNNDLYADVNSISDNALLRSSVKVINNIVLYNGSDRKYAADVEYIDNIGVNEKDSFYIDFVQTRLNCGWVSHVTLNIAFTLTTPNGTVYLKYIDHTFKGNDDNQSCQLFNSSVLNEDGVYTVSMSGSVAGGTTVEQGSSFSFRYDNTAPTAVLNGVKNNGTTKSNVTASTSSENTMQLHRTSPTQNDWQYTGWLISEEGTYRLEVSDGINVTNYYFIIDKTAPRGTLNGVTEGGVTSGEVTFTWTENGATATLDGKSYSSGKVINSDGFHAITLKDKVGNENTYNFTIDASRPYVANAEAIAAWFGLSNNKINYISSGQIGDGDIDLGTQAPGFDINFTDSYSDFAVKATIKPYEYDTFGNITIGSEQNIAYGNNAKFNKSGEYVLVITDVFNHKLILRFILKVTPNLNDRAYVEKLSFLICHDENADNILSISENDYKNGIRIKYYLNGVEGFIGNNILSAGYLQQLINASTSINIPACKIQVTSIKTGELYFVKLFTCSFTSPKIKNENELKKIFKGSNADYWGITRSEFAFNINVNIFELDITARLEQTLMAYDSRDILYAKEIQSVVYTSGAKIVNNGYYKLILEDSIGRVTAIKFSLIKEFKSANEYMLKNEYYIAPNYVSVKLPVAFGDFEIRTIENVKNRYLGKFSAEKSYLFENVNNAAEFVFAAEYSICVQKTANGFLYRAGNQGIQVAYNSYEKLSEKIRQVTKAYISEKSYEITDKPYIDYTSTAIMDVELKYNASYLNITELNYNGKVYDNVLMADNTYYLRINSVSVFNDINSEIIITHIDTGSTWSTSKNIEFGTLTGGANGLYQLTEQCPGGDVSFTTSYYVYIDNIAPVADITSIKANGRTESNTVTVGDTIVIQAAEFKLNSIIDSTDMYCMIKLTGYGFNNAISVMRGEMPDIIISANLGHKGLYFVEVYDRAKNIFAFEVYIMGKAPEASFTKNGSGDSEYVTLNITLPDKFSVVIDLSIARNKTEDNNGILSEDSDNTSITPAILTYIFRKGGRYTVVIKDNYERTTVIELRYIKDMPEITADGLNKARRVNNNVVISIPLNAIFTVTALNNSQFKYNTLSDSSQGKQIITISPRNEYNEILEIEDTIIIKAWYESDPDAYNDLSYILDTVAPNIEILSEGSTSLSGSVFSEAVKFSYDGDVKDFRVTRGGKYYSYVSGQLIRNDGIYEATATDIAGNTTVKEVVVDMQVSYAIVYGNNKQYASSYENIEGVSVTVVKSFKISGEEQIAITATKDGYEFDYMLGDTVSVNGLYVIKMQDNVANNVTLAIRVISSISDVAVYSESNKLVGYNTSSKESIRIEISELSYIKKIEYKRGVIYSTYLIGEYISVAGNYDFFVEDVVGNELYFSINIDKQIDMSISFDKSYALSDDAVLTKRFKISLSEIGANCNLIFNNEVIDYKSNTWYTANGLYEYHAYDNVGNEVIGKIKVIGETLPSLTIENSHGEKIVENSITNQNFIISWDIDDYISSVKINGEFINSGTKFERDGKYNIEIIDLLERTKTFVITLVTSVDYLINYKGNYELEEGNRIITLTRGFGITSSSELTISAQLDGTATVIDLWKTYSTAGDWEIELKDVAGNITALYIRVLDKAFMPILVDTDGKEILSGATTNKSVTIIYDELISEIIVDGYKYISGEYITTTGKHTVNIVDCIGNNAVMNFISDFAVDCTINYGKKFEKTDCILTNKFSIVHNEPLVANVMFNGEYIKPINGYYTATGIYEILIKDTVGNLAEYRIEIDNRMPEINFLNSHGEKISDYVINCDFTVNWSESMNIAEVKVNGITQDNNSLISTIGKHTVEITNLLGISVVKIIEIRRNVLYELKLGKSYYYTANGNTIILTDEFNINGKDISIICITENGTITLNDGQIYSTEGHCRVVIADIAGNTETLYFNISTKAISGVVIIDGVKYEQNTSTNKTFSIEYDKFVKTVSVNGKAYIVGAAVNTEGKHIIQYVDVLGRKSEQIIDIDLTIELEIEYSKIDTIDNLEILLSKKLLLNAGEDLAIRVWRDGEEIYEFNGSVVDGLYEISAIDNVGNQLIKFIIVDNKPPKIEVSDLDANNAVHVKISDKTKIDVEVYKKQEKWLSGQTEFVIDENGSFTIKASDALGNYADMKIFTDMEVDVAANFLNGQSVNFKPKFTVNEEITYTLQHDGITIEYKLNDEIVEKGVYTICFKDKQNNELVLKFNYMGNSKKQQICNWQLPENYDGYVIKFDGITMDIECDSSGQIKLDSDGLYNIEISVDGKKYQNSIQIIAKPPKIELTGVGAELITTEKVSISSSSDYIVYHNGIKMGQPGTVTDPGKYKIVATDEVGNVKTLEFEIQYSLNASSIFLVIMASMISAFALILLMRYMVNHKKIKSKLNNKN